MAAGGTTLNHWNTNTIRGGDLISLIEYMREDGLSNGLSLVEVTFAHI